MMVDVEQVWDWLKEVPDPEIPAVSVVDLGIIRDVQWQGSGDDAQLTVSVTPTYSGCPATLYIDNSIRQTLQDHGIRNLHLEHRIAPPWTTDWITEAGHAKLKAFGIAPPVGRAADGPNRNPSVNCPRCDSANTRRVSEFGSTPCKAHYQCKDCLEPFDYFRCH